MTKLSDTDLIRCPSAQPSSDGLVIGVVTGTAEQRRIGYLTEPQPVTEAILGLAGQAAPAQVFRMASPCMGDGCKHFSGSDCMLVKRIVASYDPVVSGLPPCQIRPTCRWFRQEGAPPACAALRWSPTAMRIRNCNDGWPIPKLLPKGNSLAGDRCRR